MIEFFANIFGYLLNYLYNIIQNYGFALIIFSIIIKIILVPLSIKQQKTMKKTNEIQGKLKEIQSKYKGNQEKINQESMDLYKREKMSPFSGCLSAIIQIILLLSMFYLVRSPLTHMKKIDPTIIENYSNEIKQEAQDNNEKSSVYPEITIIKEKGAQDSNVYINMEFLGLDLSEVPTQSLNDVRVYIIPVLYVITSIISMKMSMNIKKKDDNEKKENTELDAVASANKNMMYIMPIMSVSIAIIAPLGLALYWLVNNILMIVERIAINKYIEYKEEKEDAQ